MAPQQATAFVFIYLIVSGPQLSLARRVKHRGRLQAEQGLARAQRVEVQEIMQQEGGAQELSKIMDTQALSEEMDIENKADAAWCVSRGSRKSYRIEVLESGENCSHGVCTAYELDRDVEHPILKIHHGQSWAVAGHYDESTEETSLEWSLVKSNEAENSWDEEHNIYDAKIITYGAANLDGGLREYVHFTWEGNKETNISGGVYYQAGLMLRGIKELDVDESSTSDVHEEGSKDVREDNIVWHSAKKGAAVGVGGGLLGMAGFKVVATYVLGNTIKNTALVKGAMLAGVGGGAAVAVIGVVVGSVIGLLGMAGVLKLFRDQGLSGADKFFDKLWCLDLKTCVKDADNYHGEGAHAVTILVPEGGECPEDADNSWWFR